MFVVIGKKDGKCRILDTEDGKVDVCTFKEVYHYITNLGIEIKGATEDGILVVHSNFEDVFSDFFRLMRDSSSFSYKQSDVENGYAAVRDWGRCSQTS